MPDELEMEGDELEVDLDEGKKETKGTKSTADVERVQQAPKQEEMELEIEEEDDTPPEDRNKEPLPEK